MKILLDYVFPITVISPTPQASTAFLKQVCLVAQPKSMVSPQVTLCTSMSAVAALTNNTDAQQLFNAGMTRVWVCVNADLDIATLLESHSGDFYTILIGSEFSDGDFADIDFPFECVVGVSTESKVTAAAQAALPNRAAFFTSSTNHAKNMFYAFGKLLSNSLNWLNNQYVSMPLNDGIATLGDANELFDDRISFVLNDSEFANRLGFFAAGGKAIIAPYVTKNLRIDLQSRAVSWIAANQPQYTVTEASLLETRLQEDVINLYISRGWIADGVISVTLAEDNFIAAGEINIAEPKALWRVFSEMRQTL